MSLENKAGYVRERASPTTVMGGYKAMKGKRLYQSAKACNNAEWEIATTDKLPRHGTTMTFLFSIGKSEEFRTNRYVAMVEIWKNFCLDRNMRGW